MIEIQKPKIECISASDDNKNMSFVVEPLERGFGTTLGNCLRRILLSSLPGAAPVGIKIEGATHEFSHVSGVKEDVTDIILNLKGLAVKAYTEDINFKQVCTINKHTPGVVTAADIEHSSDIEIMNPDMYICTLEEGASLNMAITIGVGRGYVSAAENRKGAIAQEEDATFIPIDSIFTPVETASYIVEGARQGGNMNFEKLTINVLTNGTLTPKEVISLSAKIMATHIDLFVNLSENVIDVSLKADDVEVTTKSTETTIEELDLTCRSYNCLKRSNINTIEDLVKKSEDDLMKARNLGKKSINEIIEKLAARGLSLKSKEDI